MRYTKRALLIFGAGLLLGLVVVVGELRPLDRIASGLIALGLVLIPLAMIIDWWRGAKALRRPKRVARQRAKGRARRPALAARRGAPAKKPGRPKR